MGRKKLEVNEDAARQLGDHLRQLRRAAGYRAVADASDTPGCPAAMQTIYAYERGTLVPSLRQFLELVEFYSLDTRDAPADVRPQAIVAIVDALSSPLYYVERARELTARLQARSSSRRARRPREQEP